MKRVRDLERRLESLVEGLAGRVFRGQLHPAELGARLVREADLATFEGEAGPTIPNVFVFRMAQRDLGTDAAPAALCRQLAQVLEEEAADRGWRLEGPVEVAVEAEERVPPGAVECHSEVRLGPLIPWGHLKERDGERRLPLRHNRIRIGRSAGLDVVLEQPEVSRLHAMIWREGGQVWLMDLGSSNGTFLDRSPVTGPALVYPGSIVSFGSATFAYRPG